MADDHDDRDRATPVVCDEPHRPDVEAIQHRREIICHVGLEVVVVGSGAPAGTPQIRAQHAVAVSRQWRDQLVPLPPVLREAVHEHHRRPVRGPGVGDVNRDTAAYVYEPVLDALECRN